MNNPHWMGFSRTAIAFAVAAVSVVAAAPALAQNTTSAIGGRVLNAAGAPVAGATVTILHVESGSTNTATTDAEGRYAARGLRVGGPYTITVSGGGLVDVQNNVFLALAETTLVDSRLRPTGETIVITGRGVSDKFNSANMGAGTNIGTRELAGLASIQRNLQDYARTDPRLSQTDKDRGEISAAGQNVRFNSITIDGVTTNDTFGLNANNLPTLKQPISIETIASVQVNISNYDVTQKGYTGANINAVTKSGTNEFKGSVYYVTRDDSLVGKRYNRANNTYFKRAPFEESTTGFTLGGPIIKDKLFFFANYEELTSSRASPTFGPLGSSATNVGITQAAIDSTVAIARNTWGFDAGASTVPQGLEVSVKDTLLKLDWNITDSHRASLRYTKTEQAEPNIAGFSATGLSLSSFWWNQGTELDSVVVQWFADWTPDLSTEFKYSTRDFKTRPAQVNGTRLPAIGLRFADPIDGNPSGVNTNPRFLNLGTELSRQLNALSTETTDLYFGGTYILGKHEIKAGIDYADNNVYNAFVQNVNGNYTFACEPGSYSFGTVLGNNCIGNFTPTGGGANVPMTSAQRDLAVLENFQRGLPSAYTVQQALGGRTLNDAVAIWSYANTGLFLQDTFKPTQNLSLTLGVRYDKQSAPTKPLFNANAAAPAGPLGANGRATGGFGLDNSATLDGNDLVQPRVGFNLRFDTERRMQLRGGFGLFQGAAANVWLSNPFSNTGIAVAQRSCASYLACSTAFNTGQLRFSANPDAQPTLTNNPPAPNVDFLSSSLEQPSVWKANLAFDAELPELPLVGGGIVAGFEWLHTRVNSAIYYQNLNLGAPTLRGPDGRPLFWRAEGRNTACWNVNGTPITTGACATPSGQSRTRALSNPSFFNALLATDTNRGGGNAITLSLSKPATSGFGWSVAYTKTTAEEVSPLTSSTSNSNWNNKNSFDPNEGTLQNSNYLIKDRFIASATWSKAFFSTYRTSVGLFYEGRRGKPFSWTYLNDFNGDAIGGNDLMYVPDGPGSNQVVFRGGAAEETLFWQIVEGNEALRAAKGGVVGRNNSFAPWVNYVDMRFSQELPGFMKGHKTTVVLDVLNFGNLLNKKWGRIDEIDFPSRRGFVNYNGVDAQGRYQYSLGQLRDFTTKQESGESQWAVQATLRYEF